ncbi:STM4504/CBY_0614 family protein [Psychrobacter proteolyticus]|uniref:STM4504/CBY_0614 family protein n=1 Tax=Psychrobacter proteolyticus TaxID=147825 RepID=UPI00311D5AB2
MVMHDLYFKRQKQLRGEYPDIYQYEELPETLKIQIIHIWNETIGEDSVYNNRRSNSLNREYLQKCHNILCKELGVFKLNRDDRDNEMHILYFKSISLYFLKESDIEKILSVIELMLKIIHSFIKRHNNTIKITDVISELNQRFREHGVGYQYESDQIVRVDSEFIHAEAVKPALQLLSNPMYKGAQEEFLKAHEHYRHSRYDAALTDCLKSFESTMKIIIHKRSWVCDKNATSKRLVDCCLANELIPKFWTDQFNSLSNILTSSIGTPRNKLSGHGKGNDEIEVPEHLIQYVLHMTASTIVFLIKAEESLD